MLKEKIGFIKSKNKEGIKYDDEKPTVGEFITDFGPEMMEVARVWKFGADKYEKSNWKKLKDGKERYLNALVRHLIKADLEKVDEETGLSHYTHAVFNALAVLHFEMEEDK